MNAAKLENSERLQRVKEYLMDNKPHSTREIIQNAFVCAVNSIVSELRENGYNIVCSRQGNTWLYRMIL